MFGQTSDHSNMSPYPLSSPNSYRCTYSSWGSLSPWPTPVEDITLERRLPVDEHVQIASGLAPLSIHDKLQSDSHRNWASMTSMTPTPRTLPPLTLGVPIKLAQNWASATSSPIGSPRARTTLTPSTGNTLETPSITTKPTTSPRNKIPRSPLSRSSQVLSLKDMLTPVAKADNLTVPSPSSSSSLQFWLDEKKSESSTDSQVIVDDKDATTFMMRNIPNRLTRDGLLDEIHQEGFAGRYDFFYLPVDFQCGRNFGYAFINLMLSEDDPSVVDDFRKAFQNRSMVFGNATKSCSVMPANVQGQEANAKKYLGSRIMTMSLNYRPLFLKDGKMMEFPAETTGKVPDAVKSKKKNNKSKKFHPLSVSASCVISLKSSLDLDSGASSLPLARWV